MRAHKLTMKAFGAFANETVVDFDSMGNNIYLIYGETGSGKTTIFDGIMYALFGTASGGRRSSLGTETFYSDDRKGDQKREDMEVGFVFSHAGKTYTVERRMHLRKRRSPKADEASGNQPAVSKKESAAKESTLSENGEVIIADTKTETRSEVTRKVEQILGLNADQFRQIVMLAQGEFQKFLSAGSDEHEEILGKIYDNRRYQDFQERLKAAQDLLNRQDNELFQRSKLLTDAFEYPDQADPAITPNHPELLPAAFRIIEQMKQADAALKEEILEKRTQCDRLKEKRMKALDGNQRLDRLEHAMGQLDRLKQRRDEVELLRKSVTLAQAAEKVLPFETAMKHEEEEWGRVTERIARFENTRLKLMERAKGLEDAARSTREHHEPEAARLRSRSASIENVLHYYDALAAGNQAVLEKGKAARHAEERLSKAQEGLARKMEMKETLARKTEQLSSAGGQAVLLAKHDAEVLLARREEYEEIRNTLAAVQEMEQEKVLLNSRYEAADAFYQKEENRHHDLNQAFIRGQASLLAQDMRRELERKPVVVCPVCHAMHTVEDQAEFAPFQADIPSKEAVDAAFESMRMAREKKEKADREREAKEKEIGQKQELCLAKWNHLTGEVRAEARQENDAQGGDVLPEGIAVPDRMAAAREGMLAVRELLPGAISDCEKQLERAQEKHRRAVEEKKEKEDALDKMGKIDAEILSAREDCERGLRLLNEAQLALAEAKTSVSNWRMQLKGYPAQKTQAEQMVSSLAAQIRKLEREMADAASEYEECRKMQAENKGNLDTALAERENRLRTREAAHRRYEEALGRLSFSDTQQYHGALSPEGEMLAPAELDAWIGANRKNLEDYDRSCRDCEVLIADLEASTKGIAREDISAIEERIAQTQTKLESTQDQEKVLDGRIRGNQNRYDQLRDIQKERASLYRIGAKLGPLADTANGKYKFSRYAMGGFFRRIVDQANIHLDTMTDGEYQLVPTAEGDGRKNLGLGLKILNTITNLERETGTLSGGQTFEASLALALGLSDVVQMERTGTIQIDSMFIDEGFGSLDDTRLDKVVEVLQHLSAKKRQIGIISHVTRLNDVLPKKIHVIAQRGGSTVSIETDM